MNKIPYRQVEFVSEDSRLLCWVQHEGLLEGDIVTLKDFPEQKWTVVNIYTLPLQGDPRKVWRVGGVNDR